MFPFNNYHAYMPFYKPEEDKTFFKTSIIKTDDGKYRVSISRFINGNHHSIVDTVSSIEKAKTFINDNTTS